MAPQRRTRATSHKTDSKEEPPSKAPRKNKEKPVCEDKQSTSQDNSVKKYKLDEVLAETSPKDTYHGRSNSEVKDNVEEAVLAFKKKFKEKTKNEWDSRENFKQHAGKYVWIEIVRDHYRGLDLEYVDTVIQQLSTSFDPEK
ncbi:poly [ADP-ribose] polymerase 3-like 4 [Homarus americanus]|uniref:Poly [ADP-ribose] polymerase 3-like 4 n=1 Tax=Homarus americanus TaxID=6706 RepID=A0A8J5N1A4_HOMAM|nr:poly [ADP-ribose] polymerase 3-like 4 [Homarus americanus]